VRGRFVVTLTAWCACDRWVYMDAVRKRAALAEARRLGWTLSKTDGLRCPVCSGNADAMDWDLAHRERGPS
jgi:hypothetical protein